MLEHIPEVVVVGDIEMLFFGMAIAAGMPEMARRALRRRYRPDEAADDGNSSDERNGEEQ